MGLITKNLHALSATIIIVSAFLLRSFLIWNNWPLLNSDEGTMGIAAIHILHNAHLIFFYGQNYMGTIEAYSGAIFFHISGISVFNLRLGLVIFFTLFLTCMYILTSRIYTKTFALFTIGMLSLGSNAILSRQLMALGGYAETLCLASLAFLLAYHLALSASERRFTKQLPAYACWGFVIGLGLWSDMLILPWALCASILLLLFCWRPLFRGALLALLLGLLLGALPLIIYNVRAAPDQTSWATLIAQQGSVPLTFNILVQQLKNTLEVSIPTITGNPFCHFDEFAGLSILGFEPSQSPTIQCHMIGMSWSLLYLGLLFTALAALAFSCTRAMHAYGWHTWILKERPTCITYTLQCLLFTASLMTLFLYIRSYAPLNEPAEYARYLLCIWLVTPLVLWPLWKGATYVRDKMGGKPGTMLRLKILLYRSLLAALVLIFLYGTTMTLTEVSLARTAYSQEEQLIQKLLKHHIVHVYSDYWTCDRVAFQSQERIICGVIAGGCSLQRGSHNRYAPYYTIVSKDPAASYLLYTSTHCNQAAQSVMAKHNKKYRSFIFANYSIYQPL